MKLGDIVRWKERQTYGRLVAFGTTGAGNDIGIIARVPGYPIDIGVTGRMFCGWGPRMTYEHIMVHDGIDIPEGTEVWALYRNELNAVGRGPWDRVMAKDHIRRQLRAERGA